MNNTILNACRSDKETRDLFDSCAAKYGLEIDHIALRFPSETELINTAKGYAAIIAGGGEKYTRAVFEALSPELKAVIRFGVGYDNCDTIAARENGVAIMIAGGGNSAAVADCAIMLMLALGRNICLFDREMREGVWSRKTGTQLFEKTVGIIGFGRIGQILNGYLSGFKCKVLVNDDYISDHTITSLGATRATLDEIANQSDYISLHSPLNDETRGMIGIDFFKKMKKTAFIINTSRGPVIREDDLITALSEGLIAGAGLDVFGNEPLEHGSRLRELDNVIISPHTAYNTAEANDLTARIIIDNLAAYLSGKECKDVVN